MDLVSTIGAVIGAFIIAGIVCLWLPGIEKNAEARIQQRLGPQFASPGLYATFKFIFKEALTPSAVMPKVYNALPVFTLIVVAAIFLIINREAMVYLGTFASLVALVGLLKLEEVMYLFMSSFSQSLLSKTMPFPDHAKGGKHRDAKQSFLEQISASRSLRLISYGSLPFYISLFVPAILAGSIDIGTIVLYQQLTGPFLFTLPGLIASVVFIIGFLIVLNSNPFAFLEGHSDVIQGPLMEYMSKSRAIYTMAHAFLIFVGGCVYSTLFLGYAPCFGVAMIVPIICSIIITVIAAVVSAFAPLFTNREFYPTVIATSMISVIAVLVAFL
ncbi:MAG: NADH-quinone oxidoreductase subunit H [Methanosphaera sp.]|nr:NADH-quinone oxidoreductase subunit H [Methanosphaera sp.]